MGSLVLIVVVIPCLPVRHVDLHMDVMYSECRKVGSDVMGLDWYSFVVFLGLSSYEIGNRQDIKSLYNDNIFCFFSTP